MNNTGWNKEEMKKAVFPLKTLELMESVRYLGLSGEGFGLCGGGVRGTAGLGAMEAAGIKP